MIDNSKISKPELIEEKISIEFSGEEFDEILKYQETLEKATVQSAILNAIRIATEGSPFFR